MGQFENNTWNKVVSSISGYRMRFFYFMDRVGVKKDDKTGYALEQVDLTIEI